MVLTRCKTAETIQGALHLSTPRDAPNDPELTTVPDRAQVSVNTAYSCRPRRTRCTRVGQEAVTGCKSREVTRRHSWRRRVPERRV